MLYINDRLAIEEHELEEQFIRASGPGGQNVNKVASAVQLRFDLGRSDKLDPDQKERLRKIAGRRLTNEDVIVIEASNHRSQSANRDDARRRLAQMIREALPRPTKRRPTRPTRGSIERRLQAKARRGALKAGRKTPREGRD